MLSVCVSVCMCENSKRDSKRHRELERNDTAQSAKRFHINKLSLLSHMGLFTAGKDYQHVSKLDIKSAHCLHFWLMLLFYDAKLKQYVCKMELDHQKLLYTVNCCSLGSDILIWVQF